MTENVVFLTGAGVSVESGVPDFQSLDKSWAYSVPREEIFNKDFFKNNPSEFWKMYKELFSLEDVLPNSFHYLPQKLAASGRNVTVVTQNVDGLHGEDSTYVGGYKLDLDSGETTGDKTPFDVVNDYGELSVLEVHGSNKAYCNLCDTLYSMSELDSSNPYCNNCGNLFTPDMVLFGEDVKHLQSAVDVISQCDLLFVAGTSLNVAPVNHLPKLAGTTSLNKKAHTVWINTNEPPLGYNFHSKFLGNSVDFEKHMLNSNFFDSLDNLDRIIENKE